MHTELYPPAQREASSTHTGLLHSQEVVVAFIHTGWLPHLSPPPLCGNPQHQVPIVLEGPPILRSILRDLGKGEESAAGAEFHAQGMRMPSLESYDNHKPQNTFLLKLFCRATQSDVAAVE